MIQHIPYAGHHEDEARWYDGKGIWAVLALLALVFLLAL